MLINYSFFCFINNILVNIYKRLQLKNRLLAANHFIFCSTANRYNFDKLGQKFPYIFYQSSLF